MKRLASALVAIGVVAGAAAYLAPASGQAEGEASPIYGVKIPPDYRDWKLISVNHLAGRAGKQVRAQLGNDIMIKAYREGKLPFPDGSVIVALHWEEVMSDENNKTLAAGFPGA